MPQTWTTPAYASEITGDSVTHSDLVKATSVIELWTGVFADDPPAKISGHDLRALKKAESYQAAWMASQIDYTGRSDVYHSSHDGVVTIKGNEDMHTLAPLARQAIKRLSWKRSRSIEALTPDQARDIRGKKSAEHMSNSDNDDHLNWEPM